MKRSKLLLFPLLLGALSLQGCLDFDNPTDDFMATDKKLPDVVFQGKGDSIDYKTVYTQEQVEAAAGRLIDQSVFPNLQAAQYGLLASKNGEFTSAAHEYQRQFALTEMYAQYGVMPHSDYAFADNIMTTYEVSRSWNSGPNGHFIDIKNGLTGVLNHPSSDTIPEMKAIGLLLYNFMSAYNADLYGPFPYQDFKNNKQGSSFTYNSLNEIYTTIEANIDTIVNVFKHYDQKPAEYKVFFQDLLDSFTPINYKESYGNKGLGTWIRFANSLKLRLAMHIVKVDPARAQKWAEEAVASGVLEEGDVEFGAYPNNYSGTNPIKQLYDWGDMRLAASFESILKSLNHPYATLLYDTNSDSFVKDDGTVVLAKESKVVGIQAGLDVGIGQNPGSNPFIRYSKLSSFVGKAPLYLIKRSEVYFLRAEGALRGWSMGGTAEQFYNKGVELSGILDYSTPDGEDLKARLATYAAQTNPVDFTYVDPLDNVTNTPSVTKIGVKWNDSDSREVKLEKIITQKYIALFPNSFEAWTEMRRTGYPKVFPVMNEEDGDGSLQPGDLVRRLLFPNTDDQSLLDIQATGIPALGGPDRQGTRLWWDTTGGNF